MKKYVRPLFIGLLALLVLIQFYRPARNNSNDQTHHISNKYPVPAEVEGMLKVACDDCHSNLTRYPWYAYVQPFGLWLDDHVNGGKKHLNFSAFTNRQLAYQFHKFEEIVEEMEEVVMPLNSYTWMHRDAAISEKQRQTLVAWARSNMDSLRAQYPADSLVRRR